MSMLAIIPSKSYAHRAYICDFLAGGDGSGVVCDLDSDDIRATRGCLDTLRNLYSFSGERLLAISLDHGDSSTDKKCGEGDPACVLDCGESGSTLRFMLPLAGVLGADARFITKGRLSERPLGELESELIKHGMKIEHLNGGVISVSGKLTPGTFRLPGSVSSQYITGLLLALPHLDGDSRIELTSKLQSSAYVDITIDVLKEYGIKIGSEDDEYTISGGQKYRREAPYVVEGDWSQAAFWLAAGVIGNSPVSISGLNIDSVQGDRRIIDVLRSFGARIEIEASGNDNVVTVYPSNLKGTVVDVSGIPDLAPAIACAAAAAEGDTRLINAERLKLKESDRIASIVDCLNDVGVKAEGTDSEIIIHGCGHPAGGTAETAGDHRIVMMAAVLSLITSGKVVINGSGAVSKSYPTFFREFERLGSMDNTVLR